MLSLLPHTVSAHETGRYTMLESKNGVVRLDKKTGAMATCKSSPDGWQCAPIADKSLQTKTDNEIIEKLRQENLHLKQQLANKQDQDSFKPGNSEPKLNLPSDEEVDQSIEYMEKMIRKFRDAMKRLRDENTPPGQEL